MNCSELKYRSKFGKLMSYFGRWMKLCDITDKKPAKLDKDGWLGVYVFVTTDGKIYSVSEARVYMLGTYQDLIVHGHLQSKDCWCSYAQRDKPDFWTSGVPMGRIYEH